nr:response regulator [Bacillus subtilis]
MDKTASGARPLADKLIVVQRYEKNMNNLFLVDEIKTNNCETQNLLFKMVLLYKKASKQPEDIMKILMIEDNVSVCTMTEMFFFKEGFEAEFVHDGLEESSAFYGRKLGSDHFGYHASIYGRRDHLQKNKRDKHGLSRLSC